ncbi:hypothetical protein [Sphingomonas colocasiae]|uniref:Uncharacterized protein n=1 Tax=Sphingomonas colocasiae TaxID=1848973 RepID=A0ABS7PUP7_9SPHN|nr:hypothetical protein [Sphingomonas colocasiae]MBY8825087.1 hypothetical protein [Sphingomonas colocasiae]
MRIGPDDYERMRRWLGFMAARVFPPELLTAETDPLTALDRITAGSAARARRGLGMAIGDIVEFTSGWSAAEVSKIDDLLSRQELPTLTAVRSRFSSAIQRVLRRGRIKTDDEFHAVRNAADQPGTDAPALWSLLAAYEAERSR